MTTAAACSLLLSLTTSFTHAFIIPTVSTRHVRTIVYNDWKSDFDDFAIDNDADNVESDPFSMSNILQKGTSNEDLSACQVRQFLLGQDFVLTDFAGSMGFDEVTDWEYYYESDDGRDRKVEVVSPPPLDPSKPKRTRQASGSVIRIFRGRFEGRLGATLRSQGLDPRLLIKEFSGKLALKLARAELNSIGKLQSQLVSEKDASAKEGDWVRTALARSALTRKDDANVGKLMLFLSKSPFCGILGEVNLAELEDEMEPNEFYRALGVTPPQPGSIWIVYEYTGLSTVASYSSQPASVRAAAAAARSSSSSRLPLFQTPFFGNAPRALPTFKERSRYVVQGIIRGALEAVARLHEGGIAHGSIGRSSVILSSVTHDKTEVSSPYCTNPSQLVIKLADFGFSSRLEDCTNDSTFLSRAKSFGFTFRPGESSVTTKNYAMAEDLHALGFVVLTLLLTSLAQVPTPEYRLPDEDALQRLLTDIFEKDMEQFRDYVEAEEVWSSVVELLDKNEKAGWEFLESLLFARERVAKGGGELRMARELLSSPFLRQ